jgi:hypothetical protein
MMLVCMGIVFKGRVKPLMMKENNIKAWLKLPLGQYYVRKDLLSGGLYYKTYYGRNLQIFVIS